MMLDKEGACGHLGEGVQATWNDPSLLIEPYTSRISEGDYAGAVGYGTLGLLEVFIGSKGLGAATSTSAKLTDNATDAITIAGTRTVDDLLKPGGATIGKAGTDDTIREITGGLPEAQVMFQQLSHGGTVVAQTPALIRVELPDSGGFVQLRTVMSRSPNTAATIDVNIPGLDITKLKYNP